MVFSFNGAALGAGQKRAAVDAATLPEPLQRPVKYFGDVHPILAQHCVSCHGADKQKGGLRLDTQEAALAGGSSYGPSIVPGKSAESPLVLFTAHVEPDMEMPPDEEMLPDESIAILRAWIDQGAKWPAKGLPADGQVELGNQEAFFQKAKTHWSFQPIKPAAPGTLQKGSAAIDGFIDAARKSNDLTASPRADSRTLLRRLHFDLTGLPPSPAELSVFEKAFTSDADAAILAKVDELLASPHFGERWGRYWLDTARYADTRDFVAQADLRYPFAWTYRDYVVAAFNADKPYDRFVLEQIAADHLGLAEGDPTLAALGYLTVGPRFRNRTDEIINDRIDVVTRGLMGMTVVCARCHDHKYDPIPTTDFYALYGVFSSTEDLTEMPEIKLPSVAAATDLRTGYETAKEKAEKAKRDFILNLKQKAVNDILAKPELYFDALVQMGVKKTADVRKLISGKKLLETALTPLERQWERLRESEESRKDPVIGPLARVMSASPDRRAPLLASILKSGKVPGSGVAVHPALWTQLQSTAPKDAEALVRAYGSVLNTAKQGKDPAAKEFVSALTARGGWLDFHVNDVERAHRLLGSGRRDLSELETAIAEVEATHPGAPPRAMAVKDRSKPVQPVVFIRGEAARKGDPVDRRFLSVLDPQATAFAADKSGRLELAQQIISTENPLTPRVWANQVWRHLLGRPLVSTPGDFGLQASPPSHPELLDWLASALMQRGWSTKQLIRDIVLSQTYLQSSVERADAAAKDIDNRWLWRANRRRMDFEAMRDAMLASSGNLDPTLGGRSVSLSAEPFTGRRTLYGLVDRVNLDPLFTTFDFPSPDIVSTERVETLVPQQALFALNDDFIISQARTLAATAKEQDNSIAWLYRQVFLRSPSADEVKMAQQFIQETAGISGVARRGNWTLGYGNADPTVPRKDAFQRLGSFDPEKKRYQPGRTYPHPTLGHISLTAVGGHPGRDITQAAIRRWVAPQDGTYDIEGEVSVNRKNNGDGVRARIIAHRAGLLGEWIAEDAAERTDIAAVQLQAGEVIDFAVDARESATSDGFRWTPSIKLVIKAEDTPAGLQTVWESQNDFEPPPPPKMQPLEQVAHALLMTNEFLFVD
jgi:mono/diheme cytochrome c family protein